MPTTTNEQKLTLSASEVEEISDRYIHAVDKLPRMFGGISSNLERYEDGIMYLRIRTTKGDKHASLKTAEEYARKWINYNNELAGARGFVVSFYTTGSTGFAIPFAALRGEDELDAIADQISASMKQEDVFINIFSGVLQAKTT